MEKTDWAVVGVLGVVALVLLRDYIGGAIGVVFAMGVIATVLVFMFAITND